MGWWVREAVLGKLLKLDPLEIDSLSADGLPGIDGFSNIGAVGPMGDGGFVYQCWILYFANFRAQGEKGKTGQPVSLSEIQNKSITFRAYRENRR